MRLRLVQELLRSPSRTRPRDPQRRTRRLLARLGSRAPQTPVDGPGPVPLPRPPAAGPGSPAA